LKTHFQVCSKAIAQGSGPSTNTALFGQRIDEYKNEVYTLDALIDNGTEEEAMFESLASDILQSRIHQNPASGMINEVDIPVARALQCVMQHCHVTQQTSAIPFHVLSCV
jgi:hypothetical protein